MHSDLKSVKFYYLKELSPLLYIILPLKFSHYWHAYVSRCSNRKVNQETHTNMASFVTYYTGFLNIHAVDNASKHPNNFAVTLSKQHFNHAPVDRAVISQLPPCVLRLCVHILVLGKEGERGL